MSTLEKLGVDILESILLMIHDTSRRTLFPLLITSKSLHNLTLPFVYRLCSLNIQERKTIERIHSLNLQNERSTSQAALKWIRSLTLTGYHWFTPEPNELESICTLLVQFLSRLANLTEVTFAAKLQMPLVLLDALHLYHPSTRLHITNWTRTGEGPVLDRAEEALASSPCLRSIQLPGYCLEHNARSIQLAFDRIVELSPNLESILTKSGCASDRDCSHASRARIQSSNEYMEAMSRFSGGGKPRRKPLREISLDGVPFDAKALRRLETFADWRKLVSLQGISPDPGFLYLATQEQTFTDALKQLGFKLDLWHQTTEELTPALCDFIASCTRLESVNLTILHSKGAWTFSSVCSVILSHHGRTLHSLVLHHNEPSDPEHVPRSCLSIGELTQIRDACPNLQELAFDVDRTSDGKHEDAVYQLLSTFKRLSRVKLHMDLGLAWKSRFWQLANLADPDQVTERKELDAQLKIYRRIDPSEERFARSVWKILTQDTRRSVKWEELVLCIGDTDQMWIDDVDEQWQLFEVRWSGRDDRPNDVVVSYKEAAVSSTGFMLYD